MTWAEVEIVRRVWTLPGARTKNGKPHAVQLSLAAVAVIRAQSRFNALVFPAGGGRAARPILYRKASHRHTLRRSGLALARSAPNASFRHGSPWGGTAYRRQNPQPCIGDDFGRCCGLSATRVYGGKAGRSRPLERPCRTHPR